MNNKGNLNNQRLSHRYDRETADLFCQQFVANTRDVYALWTPEYKLLYVNEQFKTIFQRDEVELEDNPQKVLEWIHPEDLVLMKQRFDLQDAALSEEEQSVRFRIILPDQSETWAWYRSKPLKDKNGKTFRYLGIITDINEQVKVERELLMNKVSLDSNKNSICWFDEKGAISYANPAAWEMLGYEKEEFLSKKIYEYFDNNINTDNWPRIWKRFKKQVFTSLEQFHICKNGNRIPCDLSFNYFQFDGGEFVFVYASDISERKKIEDSIFYRREFERMLFNVSARFINLNADEVDENIDQALKEICDFSSNESAHFFLFDSNNEHMDLKHFYSSHKLKVAKESSFKIIKEDNHYQTLKKEHYVQLSLEKENIVSEAFHGKLANEGIKSTLDISLFFQNSFIGFFGLASKDPKKSWHDDEIKMLRVIGDIFINASARKDTLRKLQDSEHTYKEIYNASSEAIFIHDAESGRILDVNKAMVEMFGLSFNNAIDTNIGDICEGKGKYTGERALNYINKALKKPQRFEWRSKAKNGKIFWTEVSLKKAEIHGKTRVMAVVRNIDDRKKTEELLKKSEEQYRMIIEGQNDLIVKIDLSGKFNFVSLSYCKMFGKTEQELLGNNFMPLVHEDDQETTKLAMENLYNPPYSCYIEQRAKTSNGWKWLAWNDTAILDKNGKVKEIIGVGRDITYQKMVENALRESEEQFRSIVQNLSDIVFLLDENGTIKYVTPSCIEYLGHSVEELLGYSLLELIHDEDKWLVEENLQLHKGGSDYSVPYEARMKHISSKWRVFEVKSQSMLDHTSVRSIIYTISDITERKLMEKQVLDAIIKTEEKERERFAKDLHDDLGPLLSSIKMYIGMLNKTSDTEKQKFIIENLNDIVKESIATTKEVSNDLNPHVLNNYGLISAIELFVEKVSSEIEIDFVQNLESARYEPAIELSLYRISKELINNTIKHAEASKITIKYQEKDARLSLSYEDDGKGLPSNALQAKKPGGMGLSNIMSRAKSLNATYNFHTKLQKGFKFEMYVPLIQD